MHFRDPSKWDKMCFEYHRVIFHWKNGSKFSHLLTVRANEADPLPLTISLTVIHFLRIPLMCLKIFLRINNWHAPSALLFTYFWGLLSKITSMETMHVFDSYCYCLMLSSSIFQCFLQLSLLLDAFEFDIPMLVTTIVIVGCFRI